MIDENESSLEGTIWKSLIGGIVAGIVVVLGLSYFYHAGTQRSQQEQQKIEKQRKIEESEKIYQRIFGYHGLADRNKDRIISSQEEADALKRLGYKKSDEPMLTIEDLAKLQEISKKK